jgi:hypothetical protein
MAEDERIRSVVRWNRYCNRLTRLSLAVVAGPPGDRVRLTYLIAVSLA